MVVWQESSSELSVPPLSQIKNLNLESSLQELPLYEFQIEASCLGQEVNKEFEANALLPGVILTIENQFAGMISRRRFLEQMSRPYGLELFLKRSLKSLYQFASTHILKLSGDTLIVTAAKQSLERPPELLYEPIVVELAPGIYRLLDVHQLLVAQSKIHELTTQLLNEQTKAQMLQTEKMASLGRTVAEVAHEIRNPINCINGNFGFVETYYKSLIDLLAAYEKETEPSSKIEELKEEIEIDFLLEDLPKLIESMKLSAERLTKIVGSLRNFSHMDETRRQPVDLHECIESTLLILNNPIKQGIKVIKNYGDLPLVNCYSGQLSQVFMNIISNAIDALKEQVADGSDWQPQIEITTEVLEIQDSEWVAIRIADNGPGIPPEIQERIFETFFTTKPVGKGTGLGLAISYQIVTEKHGGHLSVRSRSVSPEGCSPSVSPEGCSPSVCLENCSPLAYAAPSTSSHSGSVVEALPVPVASPVGVGIADSYPPQARISVGVSGREAQPGAKLLANPRGIEDSQPRMGTEFEIRLPLV